MDVSRPQLAMAWHHAPGKHEATSMVLHDPLKPILAILEDMEGTGGHIWLDQARRTVRQR